MRRPLTTLAACAALIGVAGCDREQIAPMPAKKADGRAWEGATNSAHTVAGWKPGDRQAWEEQLRRRAQHQNEHVRVGSTK